MIDRPTPVSEDPHDLVAGYVLDALDGPDRARFVDHLVDCGPCSAEVADLLPTVADLAGAVEVTPPASLERALMSELFDEPEVVAVLRPARELGRGRRWMWPVAAAAAFVLSVGVATTTDLFGAVQSDQQTVAEAEMHKIMEVTAAPDAHFMPLDVPGATTRLVVSADMDMGAVVASSLPMPARGREYVLWTVMDDGDMKVGASFVPDEDGHVSTMLQTGVRDAAEFMLTVEDPGTLHPTTPPIAEITA